MQKSVSINCIDIGLLHVKLSVFKLVYGTIFNTRLIFFSKNRKIAQWAKKELLDECKRENKIALLSSKSTLFETIDSAAQKIKLYYSKVISRILEHFRE